jgi:hypothetical protein
MKCLFTVLVLVSASAAVVTGNSMPCMGSVIGGWDLDSTISRKFVVLQVVLPRFKPWGRV